MNRIKELRKEKGWTLSKLSSLTHIAPNTLNQYELEKREPSVDILYQLADVFGVSIDYLLGRNDIDIPSESVTQPKENTIVLFGRGEGRKEYQMSNEEIQVLKNLIETMKNKPTDDNF